MAQQKLRPCELKPLAWSSDPVPSVILMLGLVVLTIPTCLDELLPHDWLIKYLR